MENKKVTIGEMIFRYDDSDYPVEKYGSSTHLKIIDAGQAGAEYLADLADRKEEIAVVFPEDDSFRYALLVASITWIEPIEIDLLVHWIDDIIYVK